ncbi:4-(cytidine 5'-diphospho)-2-C-methyl-D-erythritol kinase [Desulfurivibrio alkaliphilus]|uniref:4-diphosphocytidyl-2-C-methyl-D-erythritol kinase n=1 Tax=Desulfurivibrio alkaliphilus (strain DSM 19089 / UNIQEM U267 / AHT2) TaxID=589865 RepID=D6Z150_DESAT|nr:4-(cytidine 5'-diphospho)-2-C-methyl-D-erythritol kinase [Desulfurivibrio alkaliphilus]ADH85305.1 4-diphosphocytidyl-2C-methyl-D-erythritol kinase [Desulfurivibrio alkaliphilus AHT 2]
MSSSPAERKLAIQAPAKINYYLRILGKRPDGYHELDSLMIKLELADDLVLRRRSTAGIEVRCPGKEVPTGPANLVYQAAAAFFAHCRLDPALEITLTKRIPVAAGLGGGSSDAAAVLRGLDQLYGTGLGLEQLQALARPLGADVPFFVQPEPAARARGIGEQLTPVPVPAGVNWIVLVNPGFGVSTKWVYDNFPLTKQSDPANFTGSSAAEALPPHNDLEAVTLAGYPELATIRRQLLAAGASAALMSGSGPTMFAVFAEEPAARACAAGMARQYRKVYVTRPCWGVVKR